MRDKYLCLIIIIVLIFTCLGIGFFYGITPSTNKARFKRYEFSEGITATVVGFETFTVLHVYENDRLSVGVLLPAVWDSLRPVSVHCTNNGTNIELRVYSADIGEPCLIRDMNSTEWKADDSMKALMVAIWGDSLTDSSTLKSH